MENKRIQVFMLLIAIAAVLLVENTEATFNLADININVPKRIGGFISKLPGVASILKTNQHQSATHPERILQQSLGPISINVNIQRPQQQHPNENGGANHQYMPQTGYYYTPPPSSQGYNGFGYYAPAFPLDFPHTHQPFWPPYTAPIDQYPSGAIYETVTMTPLVPIKYTNNPLPEPTQPKNRANSKRIITPDSPLYVKIQEEPTIDGIEPRR